MVEREPSPSEPADGFLDRWSRRKVDARKGEPLADQVPTPRPLASDVPVPGANRQQQADPEASRREFPATKQATLPAPSLADVQALTAQSDFAPFMARGVTPAVRNAAMKKLFADPHYNVMDGLDIYIDDYTKTTPLTTAMIRTMTSAKFLGLFDAEEKAKAQNDDADGDSADLGDAAMPARADSQVADRTGPSASSDDAGAPSRNTAALNPPTSPDALTSAANAATSESSSNTSDTAAGSLVPRDAAPTPSASGRTEA